MKHTCFVILLSIIQYFELFSQHSKDINNVEKLFPPITMTNYVEFRDTKFNNALAGCAFLLESENEIFAVTCKHALWVAKSDTMKHIHFEGTLKEWRMRRKDDSMKYVIVDKLLNEDTEELIGEDVIHKDYLVFTIKENNSDVKPVKIRETKIKRGEDLYLVGWSFKDKTGTQKIYRGKFYKSIQDHILIEMKDNNDLAGLSGSPVLDKEGLLVGIVSNFTFDEETKLWYNSPCSTEYLKEVIRNKQ